MRYPCYALDLTQSFEQMALLCTNLCAQGFPNCISKGYNLAPADSCQAEQRDRRTPRIQRPPITIFLQSHNDAIARRPPGPQKWVPSDRWFHRSHLNPAIMGGAGVGGIASMQFRERKRKELRARNPWGVWGVLLARLLLGFDMHLAS